MNPINPLTEREAAIAELVGQGKTVKQVRAGLVARGFSMAESTVVTRIRDVANKVPNPYDLPPMSAIKAWWRSRASAA